MEVKSYNEIIEESLKNILVEGLSYTIDFESKKIKGFMISVVYKDESNNELNLNYISYTNKDVSIYKTTFEGFVSEMVQETLNVYGDYKVNVKYLSGANLIHVYVTKDKEGVLNMTTPFTTMNDVKYIKEVINQTIENFNGRKVVYA